MYIRKEPKASLENKRKVFLEIGFIVALLFVFAAFQYRSYETNTIDLPLDHDVFIGEELPPLYKEKPKIPPPPPAQNKRLQTVDDNTEITEDDPIIDAGIQEGWEAPVYSPETRDDDDIIPDDIPYAFAEQKAEYPGGLMAFSNYLKQNLNYPRYAIEAGISGVVYIEFVVEKDGSITNVVLKRGIGGGCDEEAIRTIENMPPWKPAMQNGRNVRFILTQPVKFILQ